MSAEAAITAALVENLILAYPEGPPADQSLIRKWLREIMQNEAATVTIGGDRGAVVDLYERALEKAVQEWKSKCVPLVGRSGKQSPSSKNTKVQKKTLSFSLFAQMDAGLWGAPPIALDDLESATATPEERLALLQKVSHIEDLVFDWKHVLPILQSGLESTESMEDYYMLHRKWFDQGRASSEYMSIRCDLCQNTLTAIVNLVCSSWKTNCLLQTEELSITHKTLYSLWSLWHDMWFDLMQQPISHDEDRGLLYAIGNQVLLLTRSLDSLDSSSSSFVVYPAHFLALKDPLATWFGAWTARMTPPELVGILLSSEILPDLWHRVTSGHDINMMEECKTRSQLLDLALRQHAVSMLRSILVCTRLQWFPSSCAWEKKVATLSLDSLKERHGYLSNQSMNGIGEKSRLDTSALNLDTSIDQTSQLFQLFLHVGIRSTRGTDQNKTDTVAAVCAEAIEVILLGTRSHSDSSTSSSLYQQMKAKCEERAALHEKGSIDALLSDILVRVE